MKATFFLCAILNISLGNASCDAYSSSRSPLGGASAEHGRISRVNRTSRRQPVYRQDLRVNALTTQEDDGGEHGKNRLDRIRGGGYQVQNLNASYMKLLEDYPCKTKSITAGVVTAIGDVIAQSIEARVAGVRTSFDILRLLSFTVAGTVYVGPFVHYIYEVLWMIGRKLERMGVTKTWRTITQVIIDQTIGVWLFFPTYFYVFEIAEGMVAGRSPMFSRATAKVKNELIGVIISNYRLWPLVNYINFSYVPESLRVLFGNIVSIFWNAYLCTKMA
uniref:Peroxisomal membrane protein MPV17 n=1 Tax=Leptocylindrus danicus TaxID=163516 RepID=A0A7S2NZL3_9STRA|mmetsp:Transcript_19968/g.29752  ORF Transcript_19968/g.29752 Transcript_19968/m.29752 type:complete len:276 (+) Transcript_19968:91-918(+)